MNELIAEDGARLDAGKRCLGEELGDGDETLAVDGATGEYFWVCLFCRGVVRPARPVRAVGGAFDEGAP